MSLRQEGQRAFIAMRGLLEGQSISCSFIAAAGSPKAVCWVGDTDVTQWLLSQGWAAGKSASPLREIRHDTCFQAMLTSDKRTAVSSVASSRTLYGRKVSVKKYCSRRGRLARVTAI
jgi:hypothetical protein